MTELRQNLITRDWVVIATERSKRPDEFSKDSARICEPIPTYRENCPFCEGNEHLTGIECARLCDDRGWRVRSVVNKYPAFSPEEAFLRQGGNIYRAMSGFGFHEVIIEHPRHDANIANLPIADVANVLQMYRQRYTVMRRDSRVSAIIIFKNHGKGAGTSLEHPHSQIAAMPIVPYQLRLRTREAVRHFDDHGECLFCRTLHEELAAQERIIYESEYFVAFIPYAALSPFHTWIFPRRHVSSFENITEAEIFDLAENLKTVLSKLYIGLNNPDYNYTIRSIPTDEHKTGYFHWYLAIVPRVSLAAGFEMGSGMFINTALPEESAEFLRSIEIPATFEMSG
ncbi:MAG: galactose-1-phosphate uridylyltransferase [Cyanobacteria bacterium SID2]|nr:galactose-1-phosphate uridylyltransferase [Cyanobacteria bacterium SID2]MBP0003603.1 galactose-1-phosphate uridylyltransferase [Cyanobacteria bacterium SBC]